MVCYGNKWIDGFGGRLHFLSCEAVFPVSRCRTLALLPPTKKIPRLRSRWRFGKNIFPAHTLYDTADIHPPRCHFERSEKSSSHSALSCFLRRSIPIFRITHRTLYRCARKIKGFARDDDTGIALSKHIRCTLHEINPSPHTVISSAVEKSSLHSALSCSFRKRFPLFRYHTYDIIPFCKKDPSTSLGMTIQE